MSRKKRLPIILSIAATLGMIAATATYLLMASPKPKSEQPNLAPSQLFPIVRLHDASNGRFFCSGTVISDKYVLTAAHCVVRQTLFLSSELEQIEIRTNSGASMGLLATVAGANPRQDVAILEGDFRAFAKMKIEIDPNAIDKAFTQSTRIVACGYPAGGKLNCNDVKYAHFYEFFYRAQAHLYPGQSGGPVIDMDTGLIIGVNTAVFENSVILAPLSELFAQLDLDEAA